MTFYRYWPVTAVQHYQLFQRTPKLNTSDGSSTLQNNLIAFLQGVNLSRFYAYRQSAPQCRLESCASHWLSMTICGGVSGDGFVITEVMQSSLCVINTDVTALTWKAQRKSLMQCSIGNSSRILWISSTVIWLQQAMTTNQQKMILVSNNLVQ